MIKTKHISRIREQCACFSHDEEIISVKGKNILPLRRSAKSSLNFIKKESDYKIFINDYYKRLMVCLIFIALMNNEYCNAAMDKKTPSNLVDR